MWPEWTLAQVIQIAHIDIIKEPPSFISSLSFKEEEDPTQSEPG